METVYILPMFVHITLALTHLGRVTHICVSKLTTIGSDNGLSPVRCQAIIWSNSGILLIRTLGTNFSEILSKIRSFSFKQMHLKMSSAKMAAILSKGRWVNADVRDTNMGSKCTVVNTLRPRQKLPPFRRRHFQMHFPEWKYTNC